MTTIKLLILDVDGVLTDGRLPYASEGCESKTFFVQDGGALRLWLSSGGEAAVISGRQSPVVDTRCKELGVRQLVQGVSDKVPAYEKIRDEALVSDEAIAYVGDDLLDIAPMQRCGYPIAVANALPTVKRVARYVTRRRGGEGAVAEAVERIMRHNGTWAAALNRIES
ncbi:MAG TPA: HAD hydrolase family protein [Phycisphaerae bacterium]|nr:HAD hydrolase family protein [Phycisphaerae bacterium]